MTEISRRRLLAATGVGLSGAIAGCSSSAEEDENESEDDTESTDSDDEATASPSTDVDGTTLGEITIDNLDDTAHTVDVLVEFDGEWETWETETLAADSGISLRRSWSSEPGRFRVTARLDQGEPVQITPARWNDPGCLNLFVRIDRDGELALLSDTTGGPCGGGDLDIDGARE